jgi:hypothetical protein
LISKSAECSGGVEIGGAAGALASYFTKTASSGRGSVSRLFRGVVMRNMSAAVEWAISSAARFLAFGQTAGDKIACPTKAHFPVTFRQQLLG